MNLLRSHRHTPLLCAGVAIVFCVVGCERSKPEPVSRVASTAASSSAPPLDPLARIPAPERLIAVGDLHGDLESTRATLRLAGAIDDKDRWAGGSLVLVQTGDQIDRGDDDRAIVDMFDRLRDEAKAAGGRVIALVGNHEVMNVQLNFDYVTPGGLADFAKVPGLDLKSPQILRLPEGARARAASFAPGGPYARKLAARDTVALVGDTLFVHGGVLPKHVRYGLVRINREVSAWMRGDAAEPSPSLVGESGPVWERRYSASTGEDDCKVLGEVLDSVKAKRMVVGHTVQRGGISSACGDRVWRIDVGISRHYGGSPEALEIRGDAVRALKPQR